MEPVCIISWLLLLPRDVETLLLRQYIEPTIKTRVKLHFQERIMQSTYIGAGYVSIILIFVYHFESTAHLQLDMPTSLDNSNKFTADAGHAWHAVLHLAEFVDVVFAAFSQLVVLSNVATIQDGGFRLVLLSLASPVFLAAGFKELWARSKVSCSRQNCHSLTFVEQPLPFTRATRVTFVQRLFTKSPPRKSISRRSWSTVAKNS